jgi:DNA modification methylase
MTPWLADPDVTLYHGDNLDVLRTLPDKSVHMCATSPPFYGLRDYGTGEWEGGQPDCDHAAGRKNSDHASTDPTGYDVAYAAGGRDNAWFRSSKYMSQGDPPKDECGKCGARRVDRQIGLEETPDQWVERLVAVFREVRRVLRDDGTLWVEIGDSYCANTGRDLPKGGDRPLAWSGHQVTPIKHPHKPKDLLGQPWLLAFALRADGWYLRSEIIWARPNPMPESVTDRPTKSHSTVFLLSKQPRYFYDADAIREPHTTADRNGDRRSYKPGSASSMNDGEHQEMRGSFAGLPLNPAGANARSVWQIPTQPTPFAHFATWPEALCRRMILAGTSERGCCPECGAPWVRDVERTPMVIDRSERTHSMGHTRWSGTVLEHPTSKTVGWSPSCACKRPHMPHTRRPIPKWAAYEPIPCTVLDPFAGSGTTNLVARHHGRHSIGIELNEEYLEIAAKRLQQLSLLA